jgi:hypothetical protein
MRLKDYLIVIKNNVKTKMESNMKILELKKKHKKKTKKELTNYLIKNTGIK